VIIIEVNTPIQERERERERIATIYPAQLEEVAVPVVAKATFL
jgi:hypothetical protein